MRTRMSRTLLSLLVPALLLGAAAKARAGEAYFELLEYGTYSSTSRNATSGYGSAIAGPNLSGYFQGRFFMAVDMVTAFIIADDDYWANAEASFSGVTYLRYLIGPGEEYPVGGASLTFTDSVVSAAGAVADPGSTSHATVTGSSDAPVPNSNETDSYINNPTDLAYIPDMTNPVAIINSSASEQRIWGRQNNDVALGWAMDSGIWVNRTTLTITKYGFEMGNDQDFPVTIGGSGGQAYCEGTGPLRRSATAMRSHNTVLTVSP